MCFACSAPALAKRAEDKLLEEDQHLTGAAALRTHIVKHGIEATKRLLPGASLPNARQRVYEDGFLHKLTGKTFMGKNEAGKEELMEVTAVLPPPGGGDLVAYVRAANAPHRKAHKDGSQKRPKDLTDVCDMLPVHEVVKAIKRDEERQQSEPPAAHVRPPQHNLLTVGKSKYSARDQPLQHECIITRPYALANPFKMGRSGKEERLRDVVCVAHRMRTQQLVDANLDYLRNGQGVPIAHGRTAENVLASEEFKRQSIETYRDAHED